MVRLKILVWSVLLLGLLAYVALADGAPTNPGQSPVVAQGATPGTQQNASFNVSGTGIVGTKLWGGTRVAQNQGTALTLNASNAGIQLCTPGIGAWSIFTNLSNVLELNSEDASCNGDNPQTHCQWSITSGDPDYSCVSRIETPNFLAVSTASAQVGWNSSANATNRKRWRAQASASSLDFAALNDAQNAATTFLSAIRSGGGDGSNVDMVNLPGVTALGATRATAFGSGATTEQWGQFDFLISATSGPDVRFVPIAGTGLQVRFNRAGANDLDERMVFADQNGNTFFVIDGVAKTLTLGTGASVVAFSAPTCSLNGGAPSTCTATVPSGVRCTCSLQSATLSLAVGCAVSSTTVTAAAVAASTGTVQFLCF